MESRSAAGVIIYKDGKMLLQHRTADAPRNPNMWGLFGGGIEDEESPTEAARREIFEELEYRLKNPRLIDVDEYENSGNVTVHIFVEEYDGQPLVLHEGQAYGWFTVEEAMRLDLTPTRRAAFARLRERLIQEIA